MTYPTGITRRKFSYATVLLSLVFLSGCAGSPFALVNSTPEELDQAHILNLCNAYSFSRHPNLEAALQRRNEMMIDIQEAGAPKDIAIEIFPPFTDREWEAIENRQIFIGMTGIALACSWGTPNIFSGGRINQTNFRGNTSTQLVYTDAFGNVTKYVYLEDGKVYAISD